MRACLCREFGTYICLLWKISSTPPRSCFWYSYFVRSTLSLKFLWFRYLCFSLCNSGIANGKFTSSSSSLLNKNSSFAWHESFMVLDSSWSMFAEGRRLSVSDTMLSILDILSMLGPNYLSMSLHSMTIQDALIFAS